MHIINYTCVINTLYALITNCILLKSQLTLSNGITFSNKNLSKIRGSKTSNKILLWGFPITNPILLLHIGLIGS